MSTVFTSATEQRIHSSSTFSKPFLTSAARTSWSVKIVPSSPSADSISSVLWFLMRAVLTCSATRWFTSRVVWPTLRRPLWASSPIE